MPSKAMLSTTAFPLAVLATFALTTLVMAGCASRANVNIPSFRDPGFPTVRFWRLVVLADTSDLMWRKALESTMVASLRELGVNAIESTMLVIPTRTWSEEERAAAFARAEVDGILSFTPRASGVTESYIPPTTSTETKTTTTPKTGRGEKEGHTKTEQTTTTSTTAGYVRRSEWAQYEIRLVDRASGRTAWMATNRIIDNYSRLAEFCGQIAGQMAKDQVVVGRGG